MLSGMLGRVHAYSPIPGVPDIAPDVTGAPGEKPGEKIERSALATPPHINPAKDGSSMEQASDSLPPVLLWAVPRSVSTAFEKTFSRRHDFEVLHEPFTDCYYFSQDRRSGRYGNQPDRSAYTAISAYEAVFRPATKRIFVKELCFQAEPYLDQTFIERVISTFIIRSPAAVLNSLMPLKPDFTEDEFGYIAMERVWKRVTSACSSPPVVIEGDMFRNSPRETLEAYCQLIGVPFVTQMLYWQDGAIRRWEPHERESQAKWHHTLESSHSILPSAPMQGTLIPSNLPTDLQVAFRTAERIYEMIANSPGVVSPKKAPQKTHSQVSSGGDD